MIEIRHKKRVITFDPDTHQYFIDGLEALSVTTVFERIGLDDFSKVDPGVLKRATEFGHAVHRMIYLYNQGRLEKSTLSPDLLPYLEGWERLLKEHDVVILDSEKIVYSRRWWYCGTLDIDCLFDGDHALIDLKSGQVRKTVPMQTASYQNAHNEMFPSNKITRRYCVQLVEKGYRLIPHTDATDLKDFLVLLQACGIREKYK